MTPELESMFRDIRDRGRAPGQGLGSLPSPDELIERHLSAMVSDGLRASWGCPRPLIPCSCKREILILAVYCPATCAGRREVLPLFSLGCKWQTKHPR